MRCAPGTRSRKGTTGARYRRRRRGLRWRPLTASPSRCRHNAPGAWARIGDRRQVEVALDTGRRILESLPYPENLDNHFVVDPAKFDFYAMDCYRIVGEDQLADLAAHEVIRSSTDFDGTLRKPMRVAEAEITLGVLAARNGEPEQAVDYGRRALTGERKSLP